MKIVCLGDSNTYGYDPRSFFGERYPAESRWPDILAERTQWQILNEGCNGLRIPEKCISIPENTDVLVVMLGTNDLLEGAAIIEIVSKMEHFLNELTIPKERILLIAPPPVKRGAWVEDPQLIQRAVQLSSGYRILAHHLGIRFIDAGEWEIILAFDGVHFTEEGHKRFAEKLKDAIS